MKGSRFLLIILFIGIAATALIGGSGCANIVPPEGGPKDSLPPVLQKADPGDSTRHFTGNRIHFTFDEFVDAQLAAQELVVSPTPRLAPSVDYRLNTVSVKFRDTLEANTTYILNFGNGIKDFNEGNVMKGFTYIFSTGSNIDSLELQGQVILAQTGMVDSSLVVMLHKSGVDSAVYKDRPRYMTKVDGNGNFTFRNLPSGTFYIYALKDDAGTHRYMTKKQLFGFADKPVSTTSPDSSIVLYAYAENNEEKAIPTFPSTSFRKGLRGTAEDRLKWQTNIVNAALELQEDLIISFDHPLRVFDTTKLRLTTDSTFIPVANTSFIKDSTGKKIRVITPWKENTVYSLILDKEFAEDTSGRKLLKTDTLTFKTKAKTDYGDMILHFRNLDLSKNPVLLIMQGNEIKKSFPLISPDFRQSLFVPGEYQLSILNDENKNGKWDPGEFFGKHKQPELVKPINRKISIKSGFENEVEIAL